ncbi:DEAD/DEAH box helicase [Gordonibacter sp. Marseille-P4307]|uniref:DEAD/DEAH box helicase n=1 Tax=Gordonibacter sp. Marseille-P4307 TaxID=2161815 RepID=UPI000F526111|nr:DEAD/DEAH box helicase [Gordonibacter sp. Marseille-P4307]
MTNGFKELGLSEAALKAIDTLKYTDPTPVQEQAIPIILEGKDVCAAAATGTGKTAAFLLPTMSKLAKSKRGCGPRMLVVTPTRELAQQIGDVCFTISRHTKHFQCTVYGGTKYGPQISKLKRGVDILIATPGRLNDLRERGVVNLRDIDVLVIDEADRMLDMGFWPSMESIIAETPSTRQTLLFSATLDKKVLRSVAPILNNPMTVEIAHHGETAQSVDQYIMPIEHRKKQDLLQAVLDEKGFDRVIVFTRTKNRAEECMEQLRDADYAAESIHSDKSQFKRRRALENFAKGKTSILVATDVLARGIDVPSVSYVVNYDLPDMAEDYVHRIGRTGRAGEVGYAISFVSRESRNGLKDIERLIDRQIPMMDLESYDLDPNLLSAKSKKPKKKPARARDIERARNFKQNGGKSVSEDRPFRGIPRPARKGAKADDQRREGAGGHRKKEGSQRFNRDFEPKDTRRGFRSDRNESRVRRAPGTGEGWKGTRGKKNAYGFDVDDARGNHGNRRDSRSFDGRGKAPRKRPETAEASVDRGFYSKVAKKGRR